MVKNLGGAVCAGGGKGGGKSWSMNQALAPCLMGIWETYLTVVASKRLAWLSWLESDRCCIHHNDTLREAWWSCGACFLPPFFSHSLFHSEPGPNTVPGDGGRALLKRNAWHAGTSAGDSSVCPLIGFSACPPICPLFHPLFQPTDGHVQSTPMRHLGASETQRRVRYRPCSQGAHSLVKETEVN